MKKVTAIIPCYNEEENIARVIKSFPRSRMRRHNFYLEIIVVDNNSTDNTAKAAKKAGARVIFEPKKGKGNALRSGFYAIANDTDYVIMLDGDDTYRPEEILRMLEPLESDFCNVVIGSRLGGRVAEGSMKGFNRLGNWIFSHLVRYAYDVNVTDVLTGYFAWTRQAVEDLRPHLQSDGFAIEMEMITRMAKLGEDIYSVPISYQPRGGESNLRPIYDGMRIMGMFMRNLAWRPRPKTRRLAIVSDAVYPYHRGGKETRIHQLSTRVANQGYDVHIYTMQWWKGPKVRSQQNGVTLHAISKHHAMYTGNRRSIKQGLLFSLACLKLLFEKFDVMEVDHMPYFPIYTTWLVCLIKRKPLIATWHEVWGHDYWKNYLGRSGTIAYLIERLSVLLPERIIAVSPLTAQRLRSMLRTPKELPIVPNGIDVDFIDSIPAAPSRTNVIFVGRLLGHKNVDVLLQALKLASDKKPTITATIIGTGPELAPLKRLAKKLAIHTRVNFRGLVEKDSDMLAFMKASDVFVTPSSREGFGITVLEANACGLPVITVDQPHNASKDLIRPGKNGEVVGLDAAELAHAIIKVMAEQKNHKSIRESALAFHWDNVAAKYMECIS